MIVALFCVSFQTNSFRRVGINTDICTRYKSIVNLIHSSQRRETEQNCKKKSHVHGESKTKVNPFIDFKEWCTSKGIAHDSWDVGYLHGSADRGGFAINDIEQNTVLISVPVEVGITCCYDSPCPFPPTFASHDAWIEGAWDIRMALRLLYEQHLGPESLWEEFIKILPAHIPSLIHFSLIELSELQNTALADRACRTQRSALEKFERVSRLMQHPPTWESWLWALTNAHSRTFKFTSESGEIYFGMFPLADMLNHRFGGTSFRLNPAHNAFEVTSFRSIARGAEVTISYGAVDNDELLHTYGFVDRDNDMDAVILPAAALVAVRCAAAGSDGANLANRLRPRLRALELMHGSNGYRIYLKGEDEGLMEAARILTLDDVGWARLLEPPPPADPTGAIAPAGGRLEEADADAASLRGAARAPLSLDNECGAWALVARACEAALNAYPTTLEEDRRILASPVAPSGGGGDGDDNDAARRARGLRDCAAYRGLKKAVLRAAAERCGVYARASRAEGRAVAGATVDMSSYGRGRVRMRVGGGVGLTVEEEVAAYLLRRAEPEAEGGDA